MASYTLEDRARNNDWCSCDRRPRSEREQLPLWWGYQEVLGQKKRLERDFDKMLGQKRRLERDFDEVYREKANACKKLDTEMKRASKYMVELRETRQDHHREKINLKKELEELKGMVVELEELREWKRARLVQVPEYTEEEYEMMEKERREKKSKEAREKMEKAIKEHKTDVEIRLLRNKNRSEYLSKGLHPDQIALLDDRAFVKLSWKTWRERNGLEWIFDAPKFCK
jgi:myosin heavy subunit